MPSDLAARCPRRPHGSVRRREPGHACPLVELHTGLTQATSDLERHGRRSHVPLLRQVEAGLDARGERGLDRMQLVAEEQLVRKREAVLAHSLEALEDLARLLLACGRADHPQLVELELHPVVRHLVDEAEHTLAERREGRRARVVVAAVAVRPEAGQPGRQARQIARAEVERRVAAQERPHPVERQSGLWQRPGLRGTDPAAVAVRGSDARADGLRVEHNDLRVPAAQVVRAAQAGNAGADDRDSHLPGMPAVTSTSISMPGTVNPVTIVVRTGRGAGNVSAQTRFQASKSPALAR
jgi:hypothetical protein